MEIFILCWISRSSGLILPLLVKRLHFLVIYRSHRSMKIQSHSGGTMIDNGLSCSGNKFTRFEGAHVVKWHLAAHGHKHGGTIRWRRRQKKVHRKEAFALREREWKCRKTNCPHGKVDCIILHPPPRPLLFTLGNCLTILFTWLHFYDHSRKGREISLSGSIDSCKSISECLFSSLSSQKKPQLKVKWFQILLGWSTKIKFKNLRI